MLLHLQFCEEEGGYLAEIRSQSEQTNITPILESSYFYWIGMSDLATEGEFVWQQTSTAVEEGYTNWAAGQPDNKHGNQNCGILDTRWSWSWDDQRCDQVNNRRALCQRGKRHLLHGRFGIGTACVGTSGRWN